jgi:hypothetical protein
MIFPKLKNKVFGYVDLNLEAEEWIEKKGLIVSELENPLIDPKVCEEFVNDVHKKYSLDFSITVGISMVFKRVKKDNGYRSAKRRGGRTVSLHYSPD